AFQIPDGRAAVRPLNLQQKIGVRTGVLELLHSADEFNRVFLIEHGKRVVPHGSAAARDERTAARDECGRCRLIRPSLLMLLNPQSRDRESQRRLPENKSCRSIKGAPAAGMLTASSPRISAYPPEGLLATNYAICCVGERSRRRNLSERPIPPPTT